MKKIIGIIIMAVVLTASSVLAEEGITVTDDGTGFGAVYAPSAHWQPPKDPAVLEKLRKFQDLKFGIFICWGPLAQLGCPIQAWALSPEQMGWNKRPGVHAGEDTKTFRKTYENYYKTFDPVKFNPTKIADIAEAAGTKYLVFITKYLNGFCWWDTNTTDYKITSTDSPYHTNPNADMTKDMFDAFRKKGFLIGAYFSKPDWHVPSYWAPQFGQPTSRYQNYSPAEHPELWKKFKDFTWAQIKELMTDYGSVDILWLDGGWVKPNVGTDIDMPGMAAMARKSQPGLLVVDRTAGGGYEDYLTPETTTSMPSHYKPEPWECCMTLGDWWMWSKDSSYHSSGTIIRYLVRAVARNGNLLLSTGPDANGELDPKAIKVLKEIGAWLKINGEAIYETRPIKPYEMGNAFLTHKADGTVYAIVLSEKDGQAMPKSVIIPSSIARDSKAITLVGGDGAALAVKPGTVAGTTEIIFPDNVKLPCPAAWVIKMLKDPSWTPPMPITYGGKASSSGDWDANYTADKAFDDNPSTRWGASKDSKDGWLAVDLGKQKTFNQVRISEAYDGIKKFELQIREHGQWQTIHKGTTIGADYSATFDTVTAQHVRLLILEATNVPTIWEVKLFNE